MSIIKHKEILQTENTRLLYVIQKSGRSNSLGEETKLSVADFFKTGVGIQQPPGKHDRIIKKIASKKIYIQKYLLCFMKEAYTLHLEKNLGMPVGFSTFSKVKHNHVWVFGKFQKMLSLPNP